jgi:hypothetical protein
MTVPATADLELIGERDREFGTHLFVSRPRRDIGDV